MAVLRPLGQPGTDKVTVDHRRFGLQALNEIRRKADRVDDEPPRVERAVPHQMSQLGQGEGDGDGGLHGAAQHPAGVRLHAGGDVRRDDGSGALIHPADGVRRPAAHLGIQADAENSVHQHVGALHRLSLPVRGRVEVLQSAACGVQTPLHLRAVVGHLLPASGEQGAHLGSLLQQQTGNGHAVAAIVAAAAEHDGALSLDRPQHIFAGHEQADGRPLHQDSGAHAPLVDGGVVQIPHLLRSCHAHLRHFPSDMNIKPYFSTASAKRKRKAENYFRSPLARSPNLCYIMIVILRRTGKFPSTPPAESACHRLKAGAEGTGTVRPGAVRRKCRTG